MANKSAVVSDGVKSNMKLALYRKYRPTRLTEVVGQPQVTDVLAEAAKQKAFAHAYLFTGQRGTGKTTVARILAHMINGTPYDNNLDSNDIDIIEIDAASNNGVDDIRELRDSVKLAPMQASHKVYIIDEFHMLSKPAFNALLKTIEEPPEYVVFILATTELQKVPATILSRVQRFHFKPLSAPLLAQHLTKIAAAEHIDIDNDAVLLIAERGGGSVRDSITLLDQLSNYQGQITRQVVEEVLGLISAEIINQLLGHIERHESAEVMKTVRQLFDDGASPQTVVGQLIAAITTMTNDKPELYKLVDQLLSVTQSTMPDIKLMSILVLASLSSISRDIEVDNAAAFKPVTPAVKPKSTTTLAQSVAPQPQPAAAKVAAVTPAVESTIETKAKSNTNSKVKLSPATPSMSDSAKSATSEVAVADQSTNSSQAAELSSSITDFNWDDVLTQLQDKDRPSARSLLDQADFRYDNKNNVLTLFFAKEFHRKRAKTERFKATLTTTLKELYNAEPAIEISDEPAPGDSSVAEVLSIVGGEVTKVKDGTI